MLPALVLRLAPAVWALAVAAGFRVVVEYELQAGQAARASAEWPADTALRLDRARANLVMFAHPQCPCSRASMAELAVIMTRCADRARATVCFFDPESEPESWTRSTLWRAAQAIPGVNVVADRDGRVAAQFGSATSGQVFLYDTAGRQVYAGGITGARGHEGENRGRALVIARLNGDLCEGGTAPVFGCSLDDPVVAQAEVRR